MAQTPDHRWQVCARDQEFLVASTGANAVVSAPGGMRYNGTAIQLRDARGQYDPRTAAILAHATLFDLPHLLAGGSPVLQGAYYTATYYVAAFLNTETWWTGTDQTIKLASHTLTYATASYVNPNSESWVVYDGTTANAVVRTVTDTISYAGIVETSRRRAYV